MTIRNACVRDLVQVVSVHQSAFVGFFMTDLGPRFLRAYYQQVLDFPEHLFLVSQSETQEALLGFVAGFLNPPEFYRRLRSRKWFFALCAASHLSLRPKLWKRALAGLRRTQERSQSRSSQVAELASLAVRPCTQGKGVGRALVLAFLEQARARGAEKVYLTTDAHDNDPVNAFYQKLGFRLSRQFWHTPDRLMNEYEYIFSDKDAKPLGE